MLYCIQLHSVYSVEGLSLSGGEREVKEVLNYLNHIFQNGED